MHFILCISCYAFLAMNFFLCISFYAFLSMHFFLCISFYAFHSMHFILRISLLSACELVKAIWPMPSWTTLYTGVVNVYSYTVLHCITGHYLVPAWHQCRGFRLTKIFMLKTDQLTNRPTSQFLEAPSRSLKIKVFRRTQTNIFQFASTTNEKQKRTT